MAESGKAVFLSYASQDAEAARRIAEALRAVGVEVWFDQSELVGGDAWDHKIRRQIKECALLIPIISAATRQARDLWLGGVVDGKGHRHPAQSLRPARDLRAGGGRGI